MLALNLNFESIESLLKFWESNFTFSGNGQSGRDNEVAFAEKTVAKVTTKIHKISNIFILFY